LYTNYIRWKVAKIVSYNVNGIRAALKKDFLGWLDQTAPDVICLQEIKAHPEQLDLEVFDHAGYKHYWHPAEKKGYSGVAILSKKSPNHVEYGCEIKDNDNEGRILRADYDGFSVISVYVPSGTSGEIRQTFKYEWLDAFYDYISDLRKQHPNLIISGDYNICHKPIDIHNPIANAKSSGFLPEEREWLGKFMGSGMKDSFRLLNEEPHNYTWWSYRSNARARNLGWRLDYHLVSEPMVERVKRCIILAEAVHSDHCPVLLEVDE